MIAIEIKKKKLNFEEKRLGEIEMRNKEIIEIYTKVKY